ncbi:hypothetical protein P152DRAFT_458405 [Eremomyces bilateralis CBS 781.70]|uniref:GAR domain-containing protein n=1 Tax=Eremomyces bilateralis CBS 781.70 TaxID=1392243 RepID=A0A6G1G3E6_9PEZI|nr:uncharacterized protein P152DRAFT_458405 [Eremomyces bilateralis CBS 781.70]KAF1812573.1 hypothetical protein P152DRAFT_458405 [Eremomyces bilateralis CBS 781.70]
MRNGSNSNTAISNPSDVASPQASPTETVFSKADLNAQISDILSSVSGNIKLQPVPTSDRISTTPTTPIGPKSNAKVSTINIAKRPPGPRTSGSRSASTPLKPPITPSHLRSGRASPSLMPESGRNSPAPDSEPSSKLRPVGAPSDSHRRPAFRSVSAAPSTLVQVPNASGSSDSDIRLYHLHRPGTSAPPLKLHIRRIGDRVMVRVGGGWADLGAYLQNYIEHHGRRTRVDNAEGSVGGGVGFEVLTSSPKSREPSMAGTPLSKELGTSTEVFPGGGTDDHGSRETTPSVGPQSANSRRSASTPFTSAQEVGLAGPAVKKLELSGEKKEWVEGMVERAKMASLGGEFGSLGNVGGVKRLFRKGLE